MTNDTGSSGIVSGGSSDGCVGRGGDRGLVASSIPSRSGGIDGPWCFRSRDCRCGLITSFTILSPGSFELRRGLGLVDIVVPVGELSLGTLELPVTSTRSRLVWAGAES